MDGGEKQERMAKRFKRGVKDGASRRRGEIVTPYPLDTPRNVTGQAKRSKAGVNVLITPASTKESDIRPKASQKSAREEPGPTANNINIPKPTPRLSKRSNCQSKDKRLPKIKDIDPSETVLLTFYIEHLFPFLFPFYNPALLKGGKCWIMQLMLTSLVVRQAILHQSSYFFSLAHGTTHRDPIWETAFTEETDAFGMLRKALNLMSSSDLGEHLHGASRVLASIMQIQRLEIATLSFDSSEAHLNAAIILFKQIVETQGPVETLGAQCRFLAVIECLACDVMVPIT